MTSKSRETRLTQKAAWELKLQKLTAQLADKGQNEKQIARDAAIKALKANVKAAGVRLRAIDATEADGGTGGDQGRAPCQTEGRGAQGQAGGEGDGARGQAQEEKEEG